MRPNSSYFSTSQTAQMLGLSVGTIQRMVESGTLQAYTTQGGHRRILASSLRHYCQTQGVPGTQALPASAGICIVHHAGMPAHVQQALAQMAHIHLVSHPLELAGLGESYAVFFMDAHVAWLDWPDLHRPQSLAPQARFIVYNSQDLSPEQQQALARQAQLYPADISADLVAGYLLAIGTPSPTAAATSNNHH
jgi:excisionase family DNA binding protein